MSGLGSPSGGGDVPGWGKPARTRRGGWGKGKSLIEVEQGKILGQINRLMQACKFDKAHRLLSGNKGIFKKSQYDQYQRMIREGQNNYEIEGGQIAELFQSPKFDVAKIEEAFNQHIELLTTRIKSMEGKVKLTFEERKLLFRIRIKLVQRLVSQGRFDEIERLMGDIIHHYALNKNEEDKKQIQGLLSQVYGRASLTAMQAAKKLLGITSEYGIKTFNNPFEENAMADMSTIDGKIEHLKENMPEAFIEGALAEAFNFTSIIDQFAAMLYPNEGEPKPLDNLQKKEIIFMLYRIYQKNRSNPTFIASITKWAVNHAQDFKAIGFVDWPVDLANALETATLFRSTEATLDTLTRLFKLDIQKP